MSLDYLHVQHEAQRVSPPAWKHYTGDATAQFITNIAQAFPFLDVTTFSKLSAAPETGGGSRSVWFSAFLTIDLLIHCEHKNLPAPTSTFTGAPAGLMLCNLSPFCRPSAQP